MQSGENCYAILNDQTPTNSQNRHYSVLSMVRRFWQVLLYLNTICQSKSHFGKSLINVWLTMSTQRHTKFTEFALSFRLANG